MKRIYLFAGLMLLALLPLSNVNAKSIYYTNANGVGFTEDEYNFYTNMFWDGYQEYVTSSDLNKVNELELIGKPIVKKVLVEPITRGTSVTENGRTTSISKSCSSQCLMSLVTNWNGVPYMKSWDVTGARASSSTSITSINAAVVTGSGYSQSYFSPKIGGNGFGYSVQVPNTTNIKTTVSFYANKGGTIYGTYQHAISNISEANSKLYTIAYSGYGSVFSFYGAAYGVYDGANGVSISV